MNFYKTPAKPAEGDCLKTYVSSQRRPHSEASRGTEVKTKWKRNSLCRCYSVFKKFW